MRKYISFLIIIVFFSCSDVKINKKVISEVSIPEVYQTERNEDDNIDSPAYWSDEQNNWVIATAKDGDALVVTDANDGHFIKRIGSEGKNPGQFDRPNGIWVIDSLCLVVERDNHRVQVLSLPEFNSMGFIGDSLLIKPYGLTVFFKQGKYQLFVTDNYETPDGKIPPAEKLDKRIHHYSFVMDNNRISWKLEKYIGETKGDGVLDVVESIYADTLFSHLLLSEENMTQSRVKIYNCEGNFTGKTFGEGYFEGQVEGIALCGNVDGSGYWIVTDQSYEKNRFHLFERKTFKYVGTFSGPKTTNTDGIWLTTKPFGKFEKGAFFAVHNDGNVSAFNWKEIIEKLKLEIN